MGHSETDRWRGLARAYDLLPLEIELLMKCKVVQIDEDWQIESARSKLREAHASDDAAQLAELLCSLVRAVVAPTLSTEPLEDLTLRIALRREEGLPVPMASCVRLARLLACKLDALGGLSHIYDT